MKNNANIRELAIVLTFVILLALGFFLDSNSLNESMKGITGAVSFSIYPSEPEVLMPSNETYSLPIIKEPIKSGRIETNNSDFSIQPIENLTTKREKEEGFGILPIEENISIKIENKSEFGVLPVEENLSVLGYVNAGDGFSTNTFGSGAPGGIVNNGTDFWIADSIDTFVYHVNKSGYNFTDGFDTNNLGASQPFGLATNGTDFWISDMADNFVYHVDRLGNNISNGFDLNGLMCGLGQCRYFDTNDTDFWIIDGPNGYVKHLNNAGSDLGDGFDTDAFGSSNPLGITTNDTDFWITDSGDAFVYHVNKTGYNFSDGFSCSSVSCSNSQDITTNGTDFWITNNMDYFVYHLRYNIASTIQSIYITSDDNTKNTTIVNLTGIFSTTSPATITNISNGFSTSAIGADNPDEIANNGTDFWILDATDLFIYHTDRNGNNISDGFSTSTFGSGNPTSLATNGTDFWIGDSTDLFVYHTDKLGNNITNGFAVATDHYPNGGIATNNSDFWIGWNYGHVINHTDRNGNYINGFDTFVNLGDSTNPNAITTNNTDLWVLANNFVYHTNLLGNNITDGFGIDIATGSIPNGAGIATNGTNRVPNDFWIIDSTDQFVYHIKVSYSTSYGSMSLNETKWYNNSIEETKLRNFTLVLAGNTTRAENWTFSARTYDGYEWSSWANSNNFTILNTQPTISSIYITSDDNTKNTTIVNLTGTFSVTDADNDAMLLNETKWYNNSIEETKLRNFTLVLAGNTTKNENWMFSARTYDGAGWSIWTNSSNFTILNAAPALTSYLGSHIPIDSTIIGYWRFDEINTTNHTKDYSLYNNFGLSVNGTTHTIEGKVGKGFNFDGINDRITIERDKSTIINENFTELTVMAWANIKKYKTSSEFRYSQPFVSGWNNWNEVDTNAQKGWSLRIFTLNSTDSPAYGSSVKFMVGNGINYTSASSSTSTGTEIIPINEWHFYAGTWNGATRTLKLYIDGKLNATAITPAGLTYLVSETETPIYIGFTNINGNYFNGSLDEVIIFNKTLSASEISNIYNYTNGITGIKTNYDLGCGINTSDIDNDNRSQYEVIWYNNSILVSSLANYSDILESNTTKNETWFCSARTYDGNDWSFWTNSSNFTILNTAPVVYLRSPGNDSSSTTPLTNFTYNVTDADGNEISNCTLWIESPAGLTNAGIDISVTINQDETFIYTLPYEKMNWSVGCTDDSNAQVNSTKFIYTVNQPPSAGPPSSPPPAPPAPPAPPKQEAPPTPEKEKQKEQEKQKEEIKKGIQQITKDMSNAFNNFRFPWENISFVKANITSKYVCNGIEFNINDLFSFGFTTYNNLPSYAFNLEYKPEQKRYCPWCYNKVQDYDELGIDCGGSCAECVEKPAEISMLIKEKQKISLTLIFIFALLLAGLIYGYKESILPYEIGVGIGATAIILFSALAGRVLGMDYYKYLAFLYSIGIVAGLFLLFNQVKFLRELFAEKIAGAAKRKISRKGTQTPVSEEGKVYIEEELIFSKPKIKSEGIKTEISARKKAEGKGKLSFFEQIKHYLRALKKSRLLKRIPEKVTEKPETRGTLIDITSLVRNSIIEFNVLIKNIKKYIKKEKHDKAYQDYNAANEIYEYLVSKVDSQKLKEMYDVLENLYNKLLIRSVREKITAKLKHIKPKKIAEEIKIEIPQIKYKTVKEKVSKQNAELNILAKSLEKNDLQGSIKLYSKYYGRYLPKEKIKLDLTEIKPERSILEKAEKESKIIEKVAKKERKRTKVEKELDELHKSIQNSAAKSSRRIVDLGLEPIKPKHKEPEFKKGIEKKDAEFEDLVDLIRKGKYKDARGKYSRLFGG